MKRAVFLSFISVLLFVNFVSCATLQKNKPMKAFYGTWINPEQSGETPWHLQKFEIMPPQNSDEKDGRFNMYHFVEDDTPFNAGTITIKGYWTDELGNTYLQLFFKFDTTSELYFLWKVNEPSDYAEAVWQYLGGGWGLRPEKYPTEVELAELRGKRLETPGPTAYKWYWFEFFREH